MAETPKPRRKYTSIRRQNQARQTRRLILEAARRLFYQRGYINTTIDAIAQEAGVAPETVYATFRAKQEILKNLVNVTLVGDDEDTPLLQRPFIQETIKITDPQAYIRSFAGDIYQIMTRMSPLFVLLRSTSNLDPEIAALLKRILDERLKGMGFFLNHLVQLTPLRGGVTPGQAQVTVWALSSSEIFDLLTQVQGWSQEQYIDWLSGSLSRLLLPD